VPAAGLQAVLVEQCAVLGEPRDVEHLNGGRSAIADRRGREARVTEELDAGHALALEEPEQALEALALARGRVAGQAARRDAGDGIGGARAATVVDVAAEVEHLRAHLTGRDAVACALAPFGLRLGDTRRCQHRDTGHCDNGTRTRAPRDSLHVPLLMF
jgi:hypothetical protein